jgi:NTP pyrophosphatase (non-canonical NTP hydrolase)
VVDLSLESVRKAVVGFRDDRDWRQFHSPKDLALSLAIEAGELLQLTQWKDTESLQADLVSKKEAFADELADCLYYVVLMANDWNIDLGLAFEKKMKKNAQRYPVELAKGNARKYSEL